VRELRRRNWPTPNRKKIAWARRKRSLDSTEDVTRKKTLTGRCSRPAADRGALESSSVRRFGARRSLGNVAYSAAFDAVASDGPVSAVHGVATTTQPASRPSASNDADSSYDGIVKPVDGPLELAEGDRTR